MRSFTYGFLHRLRPEIYGAPKEGVPNDLKAAISKTHSYIYWDEPFLRRCDELIATKNIKIGQTDMLRIMPLRISFPSHMKSRNELIPEILSAFKKMSHPQKKFFFTIFQHELNELKNNGHSLYTLQNELACKKLFITLKAVKSPLFSIFSPQILSGAASILAVFTKIIIR